MAGFNPSALQYSQEHLEEQIQAIYDTLPYIVQVIPTLASSGDPYAVDMYADYILGIDGHAYDMRGCDYTVSFKSRFASGYPQDLRLEAIKLTDAASCKNDLTGFIHNKERYAFDGYADINVQLINGRNYVFLASEVETLALFFGSEENELVKSVKKKYSTDCNGEPFFTHRYYVFIDKERFCNCIAWLARQRAEYQQPEIDCDAET